MDTAKIWLWRLLLIFGLPLWVFPIFLLGGFVWLEATENKCVSTALALLLGGMLGWSIIYILVTEGFQPAPSL